ncbi:CBS domain-containing protein [Coralliovum pocilloporae]|uniref:CBS domain-containing protein n=1 Tax=Coralliovum pocilloporae TaxID=3066369 RepID=UPI003306CDB8
MTVGSMLAEKGNEVACAAPSMTLADVAQVLAEKKIGAIVVCDGDGILVGILSERDIVRAVAKSGGDALSDTVDKHMTSSVVTVCSDDTIMAVMEKMSAGRFRHVPVMDKDKLIGIISIGDVVKRRIRQAEQEAEQMRSYIASA